jgi:hypothetical protein
MCCDHCPGRFIRLDKFAPGGDCAITGKLVVKAFDGSGKLINAVDVYPQPASLWIDYGSAEKMPPMLAKIVVTVESVEPAIKCQILGARVAISTGRDDKDIIWYSTFDDDAAQKTFDTRAFIFVLLALQSIRVATASDRCSQAHVQFAKK